MKIRNLHWETIYIYIYIGAILLQIQDKIGSVQIGGDFICVRYEQI